jgi:photosystem II stability/assembly factor-like uncharacterized protein
LAPEARVWKTKSKVVSVSAAMLLYAATGDALARVTASAQGAAEARLLLRGSGAVCVAVDPLEPRRVYVGTFDEGLRVSDDGGDSWRAPEMGPKEGRVLALAVSRSHRTGAGSVAYAGTEPSNLYRSEDAGRTWRALPSLTELPSAGRWSFPGRPWTHHVRTIALHPTDPDWLLVGIELGGVMRSLDGGVTWEDHNPLAHQDAHRLLTHARAPGRVYEAAGEGIALSDDGGSTWRRLGHDLDRHYAWAAAVDGDDPALWYAAVSRGPRAAHGGGDGQARLVRLCDGRTERIADWGGRRELRRMPYALATQAGEPGLLLAGLRGGILMLSRDYGASWRRLPVRLPDVIDLAVVAA